MVVSALMNMAGSWIRYLSNDHFLFSLSGALISAMS
jgi:hypothetical protein